MKRFHFEGTLGGIPLKGTIIMTEDVPVAQPSLFTQEEEKKDDVPTEKQIFVLKTHNLWREGMTSKEAWEIINDLKKKQEERSFPDPFTLKKNILDGETPLPWEIPKRKRGRPRKERGNI